MPMGNVSCYTRITTSKSLRSCINYVNQKAPHHSHNGQLTKRNLAIHGFRTLDDPHLAYKIMMKQLHVKGINNNSIQCVRLINSFKGLNYKSPRDRHLALKINEHYLKHSPFKHCQIIEALQADGKGSKLHIHNIINNVSMSFNPKVHKIKYKSVTPYDNWRLNSILVDKSLKHFGFQPIKLKKAKLNHNRGVLYHCQHGGSFVLLAIHKINKARRNALSINDYRNKLNKQGITVHMFKHRKVNNTNVLHYYIKPNLSNGRYKRLNNGYFIRYKKHFSYRLKSPNGKPFIIRDSKLGAAFAPNNLMKHFKINRTKLLNQHKTINKSSHKFSPIIRSHGSIKFPQLRIFGYHNIISILKGKATTAKSRKYKELAKSYLDKNATKDDIKAVRLGLIDSKIQDIKDKINQNKDFKHNISKQELYNHRNQRRTR